MGIPAFYRWLVEKYPRCVVDVVEDTPATVNGVYIPADTSQPNPNGVEFDNLYLDMNGIIHPCFHPEGLPAPETYDEVFKGVFKYIDRIFSMIRPRKLLYMAIDGVAPRAKMNQQRARRFRAAKDAADEALKEETLRHDGMGGEGKCTKLDSNCITPGTKFMELLSSALKYYVHLRINSDPGWQGIKVILSDASVPGEGEHKIMTYIRLQRNLPGFDANTRHCLYGLDADLIMLALATHEVHFSVLREDVRKEPPKNGSSKQANNSSRMNELQKRVNSRQGGEYIQYLEDLISRQRFQLLNIWVLRDYLAHELRIPDPEVKVDLERLIDDFVFMCVLVGNDFLPHVPSLEISEGAIDLLMMVYKKEFSHMGGYLTNCSEVDLERVEHFVQAVGAHENAIFRKRSQAQRDWEINLRRRSAISSAKGMIDKSTTNFHSEALVYVDKVKLGEEGWKERYYCEKFEVQDDDECERAKRDSVLKYVEGICWVMHYYYQGVCSWQWFYPYHYAPFASDFQGLNQLEIKFSLGKPFKPFDQLMGVLPAASGEALPLFYRKLMTDPFSPILDFYPSDFELDMNGKKRAWQAVCRLPFIEESRLLSEIEKVEHTLTDDEKKRNSLGLDKLFVHELHPLSAKIFSFCKRNRNNPKLLKANVKRKIDPEFSDGMNGYMYISDKPVYPAEILSPLDGMESITRNKVLSVFYKLPPFHPHIAKPPTGVIFPGKSVRKHDIGPPPNLWHEKTAAIKNRVSERHVPRRCVSGPSLAKLAHRLVSQNCQERQKFNSTDGGGKNNSKVRTREQSCQVEEKFSNGGIENGSAVGKTEQDMPDEEVAKRKEKKRKRAKLKDPNVVIEIENGSEVGKREQESQAEQKDGNMDGESEKTCEGGGKGEEDMKDVKVAKKKQKKRKRADQKDSNVVVVEIENGSEVGKRKQESQVEQKDGNTDGESEKTCEGGKGEQDTPDGKVGKKKQRKKRKRDSNVVVVEIENGSEVGKTKEESQQVEQKDSNTDGDREKTCEGGKGEEDMADVKVVAKKKKQKKKKRKRAEQSESDVVGEMENSCAEVGKTK
ncbi:hypothetical protein M9H77_26239 [Catharanthus roseus]|uniref:Uncharacterized protein n=1 Tax=Catharanthus roseus TaxID=4058 RepID=A0ACC0A9K3_CATRO|nr:hypothetical protein M9H77_26239 [Catharanthus roseus]